PGLVEGVIQPHHLVVEELNEHVRAGDRYAVIILIGAGEDLHFRSDREANFFRVEFPVVRYEDDSIAASLERVDTWRLGESGIRRDGGEPRLRTGNVDCLAGPAGE